MFLGSACAVVQKGKRIRKKKRREVVSDLIIWQEDSPSLCQYALHNTQPQYSQGITWGLYLGTS